MEYSNFLESKHISFDGNGFKSKLTHAKLFDWQQKVVEWSCHKGSSAMFEACGLGKTAQQLAWSQEVVEHTNGNVLIAAPLAVNHQTVLEGVKFDYKVTNCRTQADVKKGINITNYERILNGSFDVSSFTGIVLDESSILKSYMGKTKRFLLEAFKGTKFKLSATATPSPNDAMEILNQAEFLGIMRSNEALARWFINDTMNMGKYRIKGHARKDFGEWISSWSVAIEKPSDIGYSDEGFDLPDIIKKEHIVDYKNNIKIDPNGQMTINFGEVLNATSLFRELRETIDERCEKAAEIVNNFEDGCVIWCNTNDESKMLSKLIHDSVEVKGALSLEEKEKRIIDFSNGNIKVMITKPSMCGFGLNWQHVNKSVFVGLSFSFEQMHQASKRIHRFGQKRQVYSHFILSHSEKRVYDIVLEKEKNHKAMMDFIVNDLSIQNERRLKLTENEPETMEGKDWKIIIGDSCKEIKNIESESVHFQIFSPPFSSLYIYSDSKSDMGNCKDDDEFFEHFKYLIPELKRILIPGRLCAVHCKQLVNYAGRDGMAGLRDFRGEIIKAFKDEGFSYHSEVCIWIDPVLEMQRTKANGLLHKTIKRDSSFVRQGLPEYLTVFRKWPIDGEVSIPVSKKGLSEYIGENGPGMASVIHKEEAEPEKGSTKYSIDVWQRYASPVWFDINRTKVLNGKLARRDEDSKHIAPLQLDVIERAIHLWTNKGETVFTPFAGIGSELYGAIETDRKAIGIELKKAYALEAQKFLSGLEVKPKQLTFDFE